MSDLCLSCHIHHKDMNMCKKDDEKFICFTCIGSIFGQQSSSLVDSPLLNIFNNATIIITSCECCNNQTGCLRLSLCEFCFTKYKSTKQDIHVKAQCEMCKMEQQCFFVCCSCSGRSPSNDLVRAICSTCETVQKCFFMCDNCELFYM
jgi:hypothetical protein